MPKKNRQQVGIDEKFEPVVLTVGQLVIDNARLDVIIRQNDPISPMPFCVEINEALGSDVVSLVLSPEEALELSRLLMGAYVKYREIFTFNWRRYTYPPSS